MAAKARANSKCSYEEFEPFCEWHGEEGRDTLKVYLEDFKKEQLRVKINNFGVLTITGERPLDETRRRHFCKETNISKDCKAHEIRAKFSSGILSIIMPKKISINSAQEIPKEETINQSNVTKEDSEVRESCAEKKLKPTENDMLCKSNEKTYRKFGFESTVSRLNKCKKMAVKVVVAVVVVMALGTYVTYMCRKPTHAQN